MRLSPLTPTAPAAAAAVPAAPALAPAAAAPAPADDPRVAIAAAAERARTFFTGLGVTEAEGNGPVELRYDESVKDAAYQATISTGANGDRLRTDEHVLIGHDPFTGQPFSKAPDIVYHELTHRINEHIVPGFGLTETSRVVDESIADTFAAAIDGNWKIGEGVVSEGMRSLEDPSWQLMLSPTGRVRVDTPTNMNEITTANMAKGPYFNIGPLNHAAFLIGSKLGTEPMARIYLQTLRKHLHASSAMTDLILGTIKSAGELYQPGSAQQTAVRDAWKAVGVRPAAVDSV